MQSAQPSPSGLDLTTASDRREEPEVVQRIGAAIQSDYLQSREEAIADLEAGAGFYRWSGKDPLAVRYMRSAMSPSEGIKIDPCDPMQRVIKILMDAPLLQRSDDISQLSTAALVFRDGNHTRFGHSVGSALLTAQLLRTIAHRSSEPIKGGL